MTTKKRAKPEHLQKLTALFEQYPDGLNMKQVLTELQTSVVNAEAALNELGAVKAGAKWLLPDDEVAPGAKADTAAIEPLQNLHELPTPTENPVGPCPMPCIDQPVKAPSNYSLVFNNILDRVLQTIKTYGGATADRVRELTGMHPDDIEDAVQFMVDHGQLVGREVYFATVYEVAA